MNYIFERDVEQNSVSLKIKKPFLNADISSHTVLTDDVFAYVDFYFKKYKKIARDKNGKKVEPKHLFYWEQSRNFYNATKSLPFESSPLPMYYCMLNALKAYLFFSTDNFEGLKNDFKGHGLKEGVGECDSHSCSLDNIFIKRDSWGVFYRFAKNLEPDFDNIWVNGKDGSYSIKQLMYQLPFIHSAYISTYTLPRKDEKFIPLVAGTSPTFKYSKENKICLVADIDKNFFKQNAIGIPEEIRKTLPYDLSVNPINGFQLISSSLKKKEIFNKTNEYRKHFSYINAEKRLWYLKRNKINESDLENINSMILEVAIVHRFSEIVRYKPEQITGLLSGKENWLVHEFLSLVLDQFMNEITCEITKKEIMPTRVK